MEPYAILWAFAAFFVYVLLFVIEVAASAINTVIDAVTGND